MRIIFTLRVGVKVSSTSMPNRPILDPSPRCADARFTDAKAPTNMPGTSNIGVCPIYLGMVEAGHDSRGPHAGVKTHVRI